MKEGGCKLRGLKKKVEEEQVNLHCPCPAAVRLRRRRLARRYSTPTTARCARGGPRQCRTWPLATLPPRAVPRYHCACSAGAARAGVRGRCRRAHACGDVMPRAGSL
jgi:hypothetical protein